MPSVDTDTITAAEAAAIAGVTERTVRRWLVAGQLAGRHSSPTGTWLTSRTALAQFVADRAEVAS